MLRSLYSGCTRYTPSSAAFCSVRSMRSPLEIACASTHGKRIFAIDRRAAFKLDRRRRACRCAAITAGNSTPSLKTTTRSPTAARSTRDRWWAAVSRQRQQRARRECVRRINARVLGKRAPHAGDYATAMRARPRVLPAPKTRLESRIFDAKLGRDVRLKIIILGAGQVGSSVAEALCSEANDITVVDTDAGAPEAAAGPARSAHRRRQRRAPAGADAGRRRRRRPDFRGDAQRRNQSRRVQARRQAVQHADAHRAHPRHRLSVASGDFRSGLPRGRSCDLSRADHHRLHRQADRISGSAAGARIRRRQSEPGRGARVSRRPDGRP